MQLSRCIAQALISGYDTGCPSALDGVGPRSDAILTSGDNASIAARADAMLALLYVYGAERRWRCTRGPICLRVSAFVRCSRLRQSSIVACANIETRASAAGMFLGARPSDLGQRGSRRQRAVVVVHGGRHRPMSTIRIRAVGLCVRRW